MKDPTKPLIGLRLYALPVPIKCPTSFEVTSMLLFVLFCAFIQILWGKPLPSPLGPSFEVTEKAACICITSCEQYPAVPDNGGQQLRSVYDIVQSCFFTIFACVWASIHPNINGPRDSWWTRTKRRLTTALYAVIAPEMILLWALYQRFAAKAIADQYNKEFNPFEEPKVAIWAKCKQLFECLPKSTLRRGASVRQPWTITHGFFIQMGGFILYDNEFPTEALTYKRLAELLRQEAIDIPSVTERDLQDKSKGDTISKGIVILQTMWFVLQCIVRAMEHLTLSQLEVLTLAFAVMNGAIYVAWWSKPQGVDTAICIPLKHLENGVADPDYNSSSSSQADCKQPGDNGPLIQPDEDTDKKHCWLHRMLQKDCERHSSPTLLLVLVPYRTFAWIIRAFGKMGGPYESQQELRMPMFYIGNEYNATFPWYIALTIGIMFGAIHLFGWSLEFPSPHDRTLWQISAIGLTAAPLMLIISELLAGNLPDVLEIINAILLIFSVSFYIVSRFIVIAIAFKAILHPSHNVLLDISWTRYIPHF